MGEGDLFSVPLHSSGSWWDCPAVKTFIYGEKKILIMGGIKNSIETLKNL